MPADGWHRSITLTAAGWHIARPWQALPHASQAIYDNSGTSNAPPTAQRPTRAGRGDRSKHDHHDWPKGRRVRKAPGAARANRKKGRARAASEDFATVSVYRRGWRGERAPRAGGKEGKGIATNQEGTVLTAVSQQLLWIAIASIQRRPVYGGAKRGDNRNRQAATGERGGAMACGIKDAARYECGALNPSSRSAGRRSREGARATLEPDLPADLGRRPRTHHPPRPRPRKKNSRFLE